MYLMIDNYDSFVYNLVRYMEELGQEVLVYRNDAISIDDIKKMPLKGIIISPGPKKPIDAGISLDIIKHFKQTVPILGICLGHQTIAAAFGCDIVKASLPVHGKVSKVSHDGKGIFKGIMNPLKATRYHSLVVKKESLANCLTISAHSSDGNIMGIRHKDYHIEGVQFHPEAELTEYGHEILKNYIEICEGFRGYR